MSNPHPVASWKPGQSGNPGGKPVNSRNRLQAKFLYDLAEDYDEFGSEAIVNLRETDPAGYIKAIVALMPKQVKVSRDLDELSEEQLSAALIAARAILAGQNPRKGNLIQGEAQPTEDLQALPKTITIP